VMAFSSPIDAGGRAVMGPVSHVRYRPYVNFDHLAKVTEGKSGHSPHRRLYVRPIQKLRLKSSRFILSASLRRVSRPTKLTYNPRCSSPRILKPDLAVAECA
jgi:hypothetical protein